MPDDLGPDWEYEQRSSGLNNPEYDARVWDQIIYVPSYPTEEQRRNGGRYHASIFVHRPTSRYFVSPSNESWMQFLERFHSIQAIAYHDLATAQAALRILS